MANGDRRDEWFLQRLRAIGLWGLLAAVRTRLRLLRERNQRSLIGTRVRWLAEAASLQDFRFLWPEDRTEALLELCRGQGPTLGEADEDVLKGEVLGVPGHPLVVPFPWRTCPITEELVTAADVPALRSYREQAFPSLRLVLEPARLQALTVLAAASRLGDDPEQAELCLTLLQDFVEQNPYPLGVHWLFPEEVALRLISLVWLRALLGPDLLERFLGNDFAALVYQHQRFLAIFHSPGPVRDGRRILLSAARYVAAVSMPWFPESEDWRQQSSEELVQEVLDQFHEDGVGRHQCTSAEVQLLEACLLALRLSEVQGPPLGEPFRRRVEAMATYFVASHHAREPATRSGRTDHGRAFLLPRGGNRLEASLRVSAALEFGKDDWARGTMELDPRAILLSGDEESGELFEAWTADTMVEPYVPPEVFRHGGRYFFRSHQAPGLTLGFDAGNHGLPPLYGGSHADLFGITIEVGGRPVVADPGNYALEPERGLDEYLRSTGAHSTVRIDWESSSLEGAGDSWLEATEPRDQGFAIDSRGRLLMATAAHTGYARQGRSLVHRRSITRDHGDSVHLAIEDLLDGDLPGKHEFEVLFHFHPSVTAIHQLRDTYQVPCGDTTLCFRFCSDCPLDVRATRGHEGPYLGWYAPSAFRIEPCWVLRVSGSQPLPIHVRTAIFPT